MALRSRYKEKLVEAPNIPEEPIQPSETVDINFDTDKSEPTPTVGIVNVADYPDPDEACEALKKQLAHLKASEEAVRQHQAATLAARAAMAQQQQAQPPTREQKLEMWKQQGMDPEDARFLAENPQMVDLHDVTRVASEEAAQHHERGTDAHRQATREIFDQHLASLQAQPAASARPAASTFFEHSESPRLPAGPDRSAIVSAPVSWREAGGYREPSLRQIKLTSEEAAIAAASGVSETEYARQKLRMLKAKASGELQ